MRKITLVFSLIIGVTLYAQVGINTATPLSTLDINGNLSVKVVDYNGGVPLSATPIEDGIYLNLIPNTGSVEFLLPDAATVPGRIYIARNISDTETAQIYSDGGSFFSGNSRVATVAPINMDPDASGTGSSNTKTLIFISDGINWTYGNLRL